MKKLSGFILVFVLFCSCFVMCGCGKSGTNDYDEDKLKSFMETIYSNASDNNVEVQNAFVDVTDIPAVTIYTGLTSNDNISYILESEPVLTSEKYSFVLVKVKDTKNIDEVKETILENYNINKWEDSSDVKLYVNNYDSIIAILVGNENNIKPVYNAFTNEVGNKLGKLIEK